MIAFSVSGDVEEQDVTRVTDHIDEKVSDGKHESLKLYAEMTGAEKISPTALLKDIAYGAKNFDKFDRVAIVGDNSAMQSVASITAGLTPGVQAKTFGAKEKERAMAWLTAAA